MRMAQGSWRILRESSRPSPSLDANGPSKRYFGWKVLSRVSTSSTDMLSSSAAEVGALGPVHPRTAGVGSSGFSAPCGPCRARPSSSSATHGVRCSSVLHLTRTLGDSRRASSAAIEASAFGGGARPVVAAAGEPNQLAGVVSGRRPTRCPLRVRRRHRFRTRGGNATAAADPPLDESLSVAQPRAAPFWQIVTAIG
jgi:hypothetical protein